MTTLDQEWERMAESAQAVLNRSEEPRVAVPVLIPTTKDAS